MKIAVSGELGSGKTVLSNRLAAEMGMEIISVGKIQRRLAEKYGMTTLEFNKYMETHPELDEECDRMVSMYGKENRPLILDSRMAWHFVPDSFKIHLLVNSYVAAKRIFNDHVRKNEAYGSPEEARTNLVERKKSETQRCSRQYGVDIDDFRNYDLVIDTSFSPPEQIFGKVAECLDKWKRREPFAPLLLSPRSLAPLPHTCGENHRDTPPLPVQKSAGDTLYIYDAHRKIDVPPAGPPELVSCKIYNA